MSWAGLQPLGTPDPPPPDPWDALEPLSPEPRPSPQATRRERQVSEGELERLLWHMGYIAEHGASDWAKTFARNMRRQGRRRRWWPSERQLETMQAMVGEMFPDEGGEVLEP